MQNAIKKIPIITLILLSLTIGCDRDEADHTEILTIGPYRTDCVGAHPQECYLEYNEEAEAWHFFYEAIQGFEYEEGYIYTLKVSLHERPEGIQDVGRYAYRLVEVISKEEAPVDERPPRKPTE
ncbi:DUF4377 domain-containing protein [Candidatus Poribacteria bacterium]|nr:DUF4377 domain-containing protein [Candidatus Poribacteria bacterium]MYB64057.1 DUF4377 domain-containing protein [Candidatus Poribacteria bacterium]MYF54417.1 DUF4377 domain-containing protein [Candidatus Poribacteria bacterium]MYI93966.1 DUF4377 domain-containing protein [Candidatus Poribacteria bacterium]